MMLLSLLFVLVCTAWTLLGAASVVIVTRHRAAPRTPMPPLITVLKPLCGAKPSLEANIETFFAQDYPSYEIVFGVESADDPAVAVAAKVGKMFQRGSPARPRPTRATQGTRHFPSNFQLRNGF